MHSREARRTTHNEIAAHYDRFRPGYPDAVAEDIAFLARLPERGLILEVGCGTGHVTALFAPRGYSITALEPSEEMAGIARRRFQNSSNVRVIETTLEAWDPGAERFDLVLAASAIHLVEPEHRFAKPAQLLRSEGALAVMWHVRNPGSSELHRKVLEAYALHAPSFELPNDLQGLPLEDLLDDSGLYQSVYMRRYRWRRVYREEEFLGWLDSYASHRLLPPTERSALYHAIGKVIRESGGSIEQDFTTRLWVTRRR
jgi:SAM-dependent methyltransferase